MNIKITHKWLLDYLDTDATPEEIQKYLSLCGPSVERVEKVGDEIVYDIEITSNRVDTASVIGIAEEAHAILKRFGKKAILKEPVLAEIKPIEHSVPLEIQDPQNCTRRLLGIVLEINGVTDSPAFMQKRLEAVDMRSLNTIVDITNYVMTSIGHPTHVFDYDRITTHKLILRHAKKGEEIITLDEKKYNLDENDIIIDDGTGKVIDLPGIMGTANSVVTKDTKRILFFIESNDPVNIRRTSMKYGIRTMASTINEKNPDPEIALVALKAGIALYQQYAGARIVSNLVDIFPKKSKQTILTVSKRFIDERMGISIPGETAISILKDLSFGVNVKEGEIYEITVPTWRTSDIAIPEDIVEEVARIYGYFAIPSVLQPAAYVMQPKDTELLFKYQYEVKSYLKHGGYTEVMNYSAVSKELLTQFALEEKNYLHITNSISEEIKYLRQSLIPSLVKNIKQNEGFSEKLRLFEIAKTYIPKDSGLPEEEFKIGIVTNTSLEHLKAAIFGLLDELNIQSNIQNGGQVHHYFLNNIQGHVSEGEAMFGSFGQVKPQYCMNLGVNTPVYAAELSFGKLIHSAKVMPRYKAFSLYTHIVQDITVKKTKSFDQMRKIIAEESKILESVSVKTLYQDNITLHLVFTDHSRNISEEEVKKEVKKILIALS